MPCHILRVAVPNYRGCQVPQTGYSSSRVCIDYLSMTLAQFLMKLVLPYCYNIKSVGLTTQILIWRSDRLNDSSHVVAVSGSELSKATTNAGLPRYSDLGLCS